MSRRGLLGAVLVSVAVGVALYQFRKRKRRTVASLLRAYRLHYLSLESIDDVQIVEDVFRPFRSVMTPTGLVGLDVEHTEDGVVRVVQVAVPGHVFVLQCAN